MEPNKIVRTICYFSENPQPEIQEKLKRVENILLKNNYSVQTKRICSQNKDIRMLEDRFNPKDLYLSIGSLNPDQADSNLTDFYSSQNTAFNLDLTSSVINEKPADFLFKIINNNPQKTFNFAFVFNNAASTPFFPSANFIKNGFAIGLQPTNLSVGCKSIGEWLDKIKVVWDEINIIFEDNNEYLGIDSSIAPLNDKSGSFVGFLKRLGIGFTYSVTTGIYLEITKFIKKNNPKPVGLCGMMFPCLEDKYLAQEYDNGNFSIERNTFLSLHSGLGIDTYPIGIDEKPGKITGILNLIRGLSDKYKKPLSVRFVSDGKTKIGIKSDFQNPYLEDVTIRPL